MQIGGKGGFQSPALAPVDLMAQNTAALGLQLVKAGAAGITAAVVHQDDLVKALGL